MVARPDALTMSPTLDPDVFGTRTGELRSRPAGWGHLPPGDAGLTRRVKAAGPSWTVIEWRKGKSYGYGVLAPAENIAAARAALDAERATGAHEKRLAAGRARREREQERYVAAFEAEVLAFLRFASRYAALASAVARAVTAHATPVGSGTVARTKRIDVDDRAEAAVIAWMRHQTTAYDRMNIGRGRGDRREVRRGLAAISRDVLRLHRDPDGHAERGCPLCAWSARST
jgi:hypothetical protein